MTPQYVERLDLIEKWLKDYVSLGNERRYEALALTAQTALLAVLKLEIDRDWLRQADL